MPAPITARAMNPTRHSKGSVLVYSASPPHTPPSTLLVVLRRSRRCGTPAAGAGGAGCQDGWPARGGSPEAGGSEAGDPGTVRLSWNEDSLVQTPGNTGKGPRRTLVIEPGRSCCTRGASESPSPTQPAEGVLRPSSRTGLKACSVVGHRGGDCVGGVAGEVVAGAVVAAGGAGVGVADGVLHVT